MTLLVMLLMMIALFAADGTHYCHTRRQSTICASNDTYCGDWDLKLRQWRPNSCQYREVTAAQANKCLVNRTLSFVGDSQIRDFVMGLVGLLFDVNVMSLKDEKYAEWEYPIDMYGETPIRFARWNSRDVGSFHDKGRYKRLTNDSWPRTVSSILPLEKLRKNGMTWQIQMWMMWNHNLIKGFGADILDNRMVHETAVPGSKDAINILRKADINFWNNGLHDHWDRWAKMPYGPPYYDIFVGEWLRLRKSPQATPSVWFSMNNMCVAKMEKLFHVQVAQLSDANHYTHARMDEERLPYFDAASVLRTPQLCEVQGDGLHVKQWVDIVRAKILLNYLCDDDWNWRGDVNVFTRE